MPTFRVRARFRAGLLLLSLAVSAAVAAAQPGPAPSAQEGAQARRAEAQEAWHAAVEAATRGPASISLLGQATLHLPEGMVFIPKAEAIRS